MAARSECALWRKACWWWWCVPEVRGWWGAAAALAWSSLEVSATCICDQRCSLGLVRAATRAQGVRVVGGRKGRRKLGLCCGLCMTPQLYFEKNHNKKTRRQQPTIQSSVFTL